MRTNGTLQYAVIDDDAVTLNEYGEPVANEQSWSEPIDCSINVNNDNRLGTYEDGEFHTASYTVLVETMTFEHSRILLTRDGTSLGEHRVISVQPLSTVGRVQILV